MVTNFVVQLYLNFSNLLQLLLVIFYSISDADKTTTRRRLPSVDDQHMKLYVHLEDRTPDFTYLYQPTNFQATVSDLIQVWTALFLLYSPSLSLLLHIHYHHNNNYTTGIC